MRNKFLGMLLVMIMFIGCGMPDKVKMDDPNMGWEENETIGAFQTYKGKPYTGTLLKEEGYVELKDGIYHGKAEYTELDPDGKMVVNGSYENGMLNSGNSEFYVKNMRGEWILRSKSGFKDSFKFDKIVEDTEYYNEIQNQDKSLERPTKYVTYQLNPDNTRGFIVNGRYIDTKNLYVYRGDTITLGFNGVLMGGRFFGYTVLNRGEYTYRVDLVMNQTIWDLTLLYYDMVASVMEVKKPIPDFERAIMSKYVKNLHYTEFYASKTGVKVHHYDEKELEDFSIKRMKVYINPNDVLDASKLTTDKGYKKYLFTGMLNHYDFSNKSQYTKNISHIQTPDGSMVDIFNSETIDDYSKRRNKNKDDIRYEIRIGYGDKWMELLLTDGRKAMGEENWKSVFDNENYGLVADYDKNPNFDEKESYYQYVYRETWGGDGEIYINRMLGEYGERLYTPIFKLNVNTDKLFKYNIETKKWIEIKHGEDKSMEYVFKYFNRFAIVDMFEYHAITQINMKDFRFININNFVYEYQKYIKDKEIK